MEERKMNRAKRNEDDYGTRYPSSATPKRAVNITRTSGGKQCGRNHRKETEQQIWGFWCWDGFNSK